MNLEVCTSNKCIIKKYCLRAKSVIRISLPYVLDLFVSDFIVRIYCKMKLKLKNTKIYNNPFLSFTPSKKVSQSPVQT